MVGKLTVFAAVMGMFLYIHFQALSHGNPPAMRECDSTCQQWIHEVVGR